MDGMIDEHALFEFHAGDHVTLTDDNWDTAGLDLVVVSAEPVPGSSQCIIEADGERIVVSRNDLRPAPERDVVSRLQR
jgi:hypothetical protein